MGAVGSALYLDLLDDLMPPAPEHMADVLVLYDEGEGPRFDDGKDKDYDSPGQNSQCAEMHTGKVQVQRSARSVEGWQ